tara:strand:+ start:5573 stop:5944 length:372 start_codon:yes stop_codon:yes gene_type:complete
MKNKKGPLSKVEKKIITNSYNPAKEESVAEIAAKLNRSEAVVTKFIGTLVSTITKPDETPPVAEVVETTGSTSQHFARNEKYGATMMTPAASQASDESRAKRQESSNSASRFDGRIHVIKKDK